MRKLRLGFEIGIEGELVDEFLYLIKLFIIDILFLFITVFIIILSTASIPGCFCI